MKRIIVVTLILVILIAYYVQAQDICEGDFDCNRAVDAEDVNSFLEDFGRSQYNNPCGYLDPCNGDFDNNSAVDADDVAILLQNFGRSQYYNPCPPCGLLPKTGQTVLYADGDDGDLERGIPWPNPRFTDNGDETIIDNLTGLMWPANAQQISTSMSWTEALDACDNLIFAGYDDWRLPNVKELHSLTNFAECGPALPYEHPFHNVQIANYWSSTTAENDHDVAWCLDMNDGELLRGEKNYLYSVLAVRSITYGSGSISKTGQTTSSMPNDDGFLQMGIQWPAPRFQDPGDGTVKDKLTGLVWLKKANCFGMQDWNAAINVCKYLAAGQCDLTDSSSAGSWRLPNVNELRSLTDFGVYNPAVSAGNHFNDIQSYYYWSSTTTVPYDGLYAWYVNMNLGLVQGNDKTATLYVWPVRDEL